jgi:hypothetical protein
MRYAVFAAIWLLASSVHASVIDCNGYRYGMRVRDVVTLDINDTKTPACEIPNTSAAWSQVQNWCDGKQFCTFRAHVVRKSGNRYIIDRIVGPVSWGD